MNRLRNALDGLLGLQREKQLSIPLHKGYKNGGIKERMPEAKIRDAGANLDEKTKNLMFATKIDKEDRNKFQQLVDKHGIKNLLGTAAILGGGATGTVMLGNALLSPREAAAITITEDGDLIVAEQEDNTTQNILGLAALTGAGVLAAGTDFGAPDPYSSVLADDLDDVYVRTGTSSEPYARPFTDEAMPRQLQLDLGDAISDQRRMRARRA